MKMILAAASMILLFLPRAGAQTQPAIPSVLHIVNRIEFAGNTLISSAELAKVVGIKEGGLVGTRRIEEAVGAIEQAYRERGYLAVVSDNFLQTFQETGTLRFPITEVRVAEVRIEGLHRTREPVIRRMLELRPGDLYSVSALRRDADRLNTLGILESIDASVEEAAQLGRVIVVWKLAEREKTGYVSLGGSYSPRDRLIGTVTLTESNLRGRAEHLQVSASIGSIKGRPSFEVFYLNPWVAKQTSLGLRAFTAVRYRFSDHLVTIPGTDWYFERRSGGQITAGRTLSPFRQLSVGTRYEDVKVENLPLQFLTPTIASADGKVAAVSGESIVDRRDSLSYPTSGYLSRTTLEPAHASLTDGGSNWFAKGSGEFRRFFPLQRMEIGTEEVRAGRRPRVLAARFVGATSTGRLPFFEQYFLGGTVGLRGYTEERFWGKHMVLGIVEYRIPIGRSLTTHLFTDAGDAWGSRFQFAPSAPTIFHQHKSFSPRLGAGFGLRYTTDLGSLGLDFAWGEGFHIHLTFGPAF